MKSLPVLRTFVLGIAVLLFTSAAQAGDFPLRDGDVVVMAGDSITAQHLHSNYIEAFCVTRFPKWNLQFRNAGVGGDTVPHVLARLDTDVLCWRPTVATVELGMNDSGGGQGAIAPYLDQMTTLIGRIRKAGARPLLLTSSPVEDITTPVWVTRNATLDAMSTALVELAAREKVPCADQFHPLFDLWSRNLKSANAVPLAGDAVHLGPAGQLTMAYECLVGLDAPALVSKAAINFGKVDSVTTCAIKNLKIEGNAISFDRTDDCLPMPIPADARNALKLVPLSAKLNQYTLSLTKENMGPMEWNVSIDGVEVATVSAGELAKGWNMSELTRGRLRHSASRCWS